MAAHRVDRLGPLADQEVSGLQHHQGSLAIGRLDWDEAHGWPRYRFTYGLGVDCICLATLHVRLHIGRWNQSDVVAEGSDLACPEV